MVNMDLAGPVDVDAVAPAIPTEITIRGTPDTRLTANEMRRLKTETGKSLDDLMGDGADEADRMQTIVWLELRRLGHEVRWDEVGDVALEFVAAPADPTNADTPSNSPPSVTTGE